MNAVERALRGFLEARPGDVAIAVVGGLAVSARTEPRFTRDLAALAKVATEAEWLRAEQAVRLIEQRGFARKRDLQAALAAWKASADQP